MKKARSKSVAVSTVMSLAMSPLLIGAGTISAPIDKALPQQIAAAAAADQQDGNDAAALREYRRLLEVYPNDPKVQSGIYAAMSETEKHAGDADLEKQYGETARVIEPRLDDEIKSTPGGAVTRGKADNIASFVAIAMQTAQAIQQMRQQRQAQQPPQSPPPQNISYPAAPVGQPGYTPPPQPMPYVDPNAGAPLQGQPYPPPQGQPQQYPPQGQMQPQPYPQPQAQPFPPQSQPYPQPQGQPYSPQGQPQPPAQAQQYPPQGQPPPQAQQYPPQGQPYPQPLAQMYPPQGQPPPPATQGMAASQPSLQAQPNPYAAANRPRNRTVTRGETIAPIRVIHDHSHTGDSAYFENGCGALLSVDGGELIFTPGVANDIPLAIPATDIYEIRLNTTAAKEVGAFHIATRKGIYLNVAPESGNRDDARAAIDSLKKQLGITD